MPGVWWRLGDSADTGNSILTEKPGVHYSLVMEFLELVMELEDHLWIYLTKEERCSSEPFSVSSTVFCCAESSGNLRRVHSRDGL